MASIRPEQTTDADAIFAVHAGCFPTTAEARLVDLLRAAGRLSVSLVADAGDSIVGHVAFSPVTAGNGAIGIGLGPVGVLPSHRRQGLAAELITRGLAACKAAGFGWAVVLGEPTYYGRFGFQSATEFGLNDEYGGGAYFQAVELTFDAIPRSGELVKYVPEFAAVA